MLASNISPPTIVRPPVKAAAALRLSRTVALVVVCAPAVVILGWVLDVRILKGFLPGLISMKLNTALGFVLAGSGLPRVAREPASRRQAVLAAACACVVFGLGAVTQLEAMGERGVLTGADAGLARLEDEVEHLERDLVRMGELVRT
jgi:hypothetical protein